MSVSQDRNWSLATMKSACIDIGGGGGGVYFISFNHSTKQYECVYMSSYPCIIFG